MSIYRSTQLTTQNTLRLNSGEVKRTSGAGLLGSGVEEVVEEVEEVGG